jgi:hypothetical protein
MKNTKEIIYVKLELIPSILEKWIKGSINDPYALGHFDKHVLKYDTKFKAYDKENDFKFPFMGEGDRGKLAYLGRAETLADSKARSIESSNDFKSSDTHVIGFQVKDDDFGGVRYIKIKNSRYSGGEVMEEFVSYKRNSPGSEPLIITYFLADRYKHYREFEKKSGDLPPEELEPKKPYYIAYYKEYDEKENIVEKTETFTERLKVEDFFKGNKNVYKVEQYKWGRLNSTPYKRDEKNVVVNKTGKQKDSQISKIKKLSGNKLSDEFIERFIERFTIEKLEKMSEQEYKKKINDFVEWAKDGYSIDEILPLLENRIPLHMVNKYFKHIKDPKDRK